MAQQKPLGFFTEGNSAREVAYRAIRDKIIFFDLKPGEPVSDKLLAEELNMSRTPVREALILLTTANMVVLKPQAGTFVAPMDPEWMEMEQFSRKALEKEVLLEAVSKMDADKARLYEWNNEIFENALQGTTTRELLRHAQDTDNEFHRIAFTITGRERQYELLKNNMQHIERLRALSLIVEDKEGLSSEHRLISDALISGDVLTMLYYVEKHLNRYRDSLEIVKRRFPEYFELG